ncbi:hypothetical protein F4808DRAFT_424120 [Astrocystis sublimbata]|nr:hypothetical protein F4808DRAFT_424120 [Astrocystis sublimbata]
MMVHYQNGNRACLGMCRLDWMDSPLSVCSTYLHMAAVRCQGGRQVVKVKADAGPLSPEDQSHHWVRFPWSGTLDWWFVRTAAVIKYRPSLSV